MTEPIDDEWTEAVDADIPRVDLVGRAANGVPGFLLMKQDSRGLLAPGLVRDLIGKPEPVPDVADTVTMTGSPAAIAKMIHAAAQRAAEPVAKAKYDADDIKRMTGNGEAMNTGAYPIADRADLDRAIRAVGRGGASHDAIRHHIEQRAKALDATSIIPDDWAADGSLMKETAVADMDMDPETILAEPDDTAPGNATTPGSPAWESIDAATARKWTSILARARSAVDVLAEREMLEAASGDEDDAYQAMDLQDACGALDYAISVLAPFAVSEQAQADCGEEMAAVGKALAGWDGTALDTIEALTMVTKAGRVLSTSNEAAIRGAVESLQKVLASLPTAPVSDEVAKTANEEPSMPTPTPSADTTAASGQEPAMGTGQAEPQPVAGQVVTDADAVTKADGDTPEMVAVYDKNGNLVGIVSPEKITRIAGAEPDDKPDTGDPAPAADTAAAPDLTPEPQGDVGTPADAVPPAEPDTDVTKTTNPDNDPSSETVLKSIATDAVRAGLDAYSATQEQVIAKQATDLAQMATSIEELTALVKALEEQPAVPKIFTNGAVPPRDQLRGQDQGAPAHIDVAKAQETKRDLYGARDATEQNRIAKGMQADAIAALQEIRRR